MINEVGGERVFTNISNLACDNRGIVNCNTNWGCKNIIWASDGDANSIMVHNALYKTTEDENCVEFLKTIMRLQYNFRHEF